MFDAYSPKLEGKNRKNNVLSALVRCFVQSKHRKSEKRGRVRNEK